MDFSIIITIIASFGVLTAYLFYLFLRHFEPYDPDDVRYAVQIPVVVRVDTRIIPMQTTAEYANPQYYVSDAVCVAEKMDESGEKVVVSIASQV